MAPAELEALLLSHPDVDDVGVIGVPDEEAGEVPRAYVAKAPGSAVTAKDLNDFVDSKEIVLYHPSLSYPFSFLFSFDSFDSASSSFPRLDHFQIGRDDQ